MDEVDDKGQVLLTVAGNKWLAFCLSRVKND
jgi:hypothetical protein